VEGQNVTFAESMTAPAFAAAALRILDDEVFATKLSSGGRRLYERHLSWPAIADRLLPRPS